MVVIATFVGCSKEDAEKEPVVTVQTAVAQKGSLDVEVGFEAVLFPKNQAAITPR